MVDPTSVWGLDNDDQASRRSTENEVERDEQQSAFDDQGSISQIETSAFDDDDTDDIPFFRHRGEK